MRADRTKQLGVWDILFFSLTTVLAVVFLWLNGCRQSTPPKRPAATAAGTPEDKPVDDEDTAGTKDSPTNDQPGDPLVASPADGKELYAIHCTACHGQQGDGDGIAAKYLFPKPRDFGSQFRIVSSSEKIPNRQDIHAVLARGMPGSSMPSWIHLSQADRDLLVGEVLRLRRDALQRLFVRQWIEDGEDPEDIDEEEKQDFVTSRMTSGDPVDTPKFGEADEAAIGRGKEAFFKLGCHACHGKEGKGDGQQEMVNVEGLPTSPRDFTLGIFKGNHDPASLYLRMALGMPGGAMPSTPNVTPDQIIDLMHFILSLSTEEQRNAAIAKREQIVVKAVTSLPGLADAAEWSAIDSAALRMMPLWWRNDADPDLQVQAVHDGNVIAVRLSWRDETEDGHAAQSESFEDAVALELYRGETEPFIGMGDPKFPIDVWFWDADRQGTPLAVEKLYPNTVVDVFPFSETVVTSAELDREGARTADQPDISLPARASGNPIVPTADESGASSLTVSGPGSVTFRIPRSQLVKAQGHWHEGRWTVVMTRALAVNSDDDGISLEPGKRASVAFAVWNGSEQDRDGKKLITIWQDLELEK